jgi:hypothetical protein
MKKLPLDCMVSVDGILAVLVVEGRPIAGARNTRSCICGNKPLKQYALKDRLSPDLRLRIAYWQAHEPTKKVSQRTLNALLKEALAFKTHRISAY